MTGDPTSRPFTVAVAQSEIEELRARLGRAQWPEPIPGTGWEHGIDVHWLRSLCSYWADGFDWRAQETLLNEWPQYVAELDGL